MNFLQRYKQRDCKTWIGKAIQMLVFHNLTRLMFFISITLIGGIGLGSFNFGELFWTILLVTGLTYTVGFSLLSIIYAWIINPIIAFIKDRKEK